MPTHKVTVLYKHPQDEEAPSATAWKESGLLRNAELYFTTKDLTTEGLNFLDGQIALKDIPKFANGSFEFLIGTI